MTDTHKKLSFLETYQTQTLENREPSKEIHSLPQTLDFCRQYLMYVWVLQTMVSVRSNNLSLKFQVAKILELKYLRFWRKLNSFSLETDIFPTILKFPARGRYRCNPVSGLTIFLSTLGLSDLCLRIIF